MLIKILPFAFSFLQAATNGNYGNGQIIYNETSTQTVFINNGKIPSDELSALITLHMAYKCKTEFPIINKISSIPENGSLLTSRTVEYKCQKIHGPQVLLSKV